MTEETSAGNEDISVNTISVDLAGATIALQDEDNDSVISDDNNSFDVFPNSVVPANTNISIEGSSDVVIGTVAQFHGPVTIYQNTHNNAQLHSDSPNYLTNGEKSPPSTVSSDGKCLNIICSFFFHTNKNYQPIYKVTESALFFNVTRLTVYIVAKVCMYVHRNKVTYL